jgi:hypothetical protein
MSSNIGRFVATHHLSKFLTACFSFSPVLTAFNFPMIFLGAAAAAAAPVDDEDLIGVSGF